MTKIVTIRFEITSYDLSVYPCQPSADTNPQHLAYMTLQGTSMPGYQFIAYFYPDTTSNLGEPSLDTQTNHVTMKMYYAQLAGLIDLLNLALLRNGPPCFASYCDGPPAHAEIATQVPGDN
jgi:hypothetical protein